MARGDLALLERRRVQSGIEGAGVREDLAHQGPGRAVDAPRVATRRDPACSGLGFGFGFGLGFRLRLGFGLGLGFRV